LRKNCIFAIIYYQNSIIMITNTNFSETEQIIKHLKEVPFDVSRKSLYITSELYEGYCPEQPNSYEKCYDKRIFNYYKSTGIQTNDIKESLARTLHDHGIYTALGEFVRAHDYRRIVGVMGGHALLRTDSMYHQIVFLSKRLTEQGFFMLSGGGPGAMEATHVGAWLAGCNDNEVEDALQIMSVAPKFNHDLWLSTAFEVIRKYPQVRYESIGIPTWLYGHEPSTPFATHIAKFFDNSIRENQILTLPFGGIIYTPGSAGTMQEIFQDAVQNHYLSFGFSSPMIFLGTQFWTKEVPIYPLLQLLTGNGKYNNLLLALTDNSDEIAQKLIEFQELVKNRPKLV